MATEGPDGIKAWRHTFAAPLTVTITKLEELAFENGARIVGPDSAGYKYVVIGSDDGFYDVYRAPDVDWDKIGVTQATVAAPAVQNAPAAYTVSAGKRVQLLSVYYSLVTDANAANRYQTVVITDGTNTVLTMMTDTTAQTASTTVTRSIARYGAEITTGLTRKYISPILELPAGYTITTSCSNLQAADQYGVTRLLIKEAPA